MRRKKTAGVIAVLLALLMAVTLIPAAAASAYAADRMGTVAEGTAFEEQLDDADEAVLSEALSDADSGEIALPEENPDTGMVSLEEEPGGPDAGIVSLEESASVQKINLGASHLVPKDYIYFGTPKEAEGIELPDKLWRVLETDAVQDRAMLISERILAFDYFDESHNNNDWNTSNARQWCLDYYDSFGSESERAAVRETTKHDGVYQTGAQEIFGELDIENEHFFLLSAEEADTLFDGAADRVAYAVGATVADGDDNWWLRSGRPDRPDLVAFVFLHGQINNYFPNTTAENPGQWGRVGMRPAFNLDYSKVLLTSQAQGGKDPCAIGTMRAISETTANVWELTLLDENRSFTATYEDGTTAHVVEMKSSGWNETISYSGAQEGNNEYVSVILTDEMDTPLYYGTIAVNSESGTADLNIPNTLEEGLYKLNVFSEQNNEDFITDYASAFSQLYFEVRANTAVLSFDPNGGSGEMESVSANKEGKWIVPECAYTHPEGLLFSGWNTVAVPTYQNYGIWYDPGDTMELTENVTLYARWREPFLSVCSYNLTTGEHASGGQFDLTADEGWWYGGHLSYGCNNYTLITGSRITLTAYPDEGYRFVGWYNGKYINEDADGNLIQDAEPYLDQEPLSEEMEFSFTAEGDMTICPVFAKLMPYAKFDTGTSTLTFFGSMEIYENGQTETYVDSEGNEQTITYFAEIESSSFPKWYAFLSDIERIDFETVITPEKENNSWFQEMRNLKSIENLSYLDTRNLTSLYGMFRYDSSLEFVDLTGWDVSGVIDMQDVFSGCTSLKSIIFPQDFDTSSAKGMNTMFDRCSSLESLDLSSFDTENVLHMNDMFEYCSSLKTVNLSGWNTEQLIDMSYMFYGCSALATLDLSGFNTSKVKDMQCAFSGCAGLKTLDLSGFRTTSATNIISLFNSCTNLEYVDISGFDTSAVASDQTKYIFNGCGSLKGVKLGAKTILASDAPTAKWQLADLANPVQIENFTAYDGSNPGWYLQGHGGVSITGIVDKDYTGQAITQSPVVKAGGKTLKNNTDYTLSYKNNVDVGTATVTITGKGYYTGSVKKTFQIKTTTPIPVEKVTLNRTTMEMATKTTAKLTVTFKPSNATDKSLTWTSSNPAVATVDKNGKVAALTRGTATITVTSKADKTKKATCKLTVKYCDAYYDLDGTGQSNVTKEMETAINWAADNKITGEKEAFGTMNSMTRGQFVRFLYRYAGNPTVTSAMIKKYGSQFSDVDKNYTHFNAIVWAVSEGLIGGYSDGTFKPNKSLSRNNVATILWKYAGSPKVSNVNNPFTDVKKSAAIAWGKSKKIFTGTAFKPNDNCLRGDFALFLYRYDKNVGK